MVYQKQNLSNGKIVWIFVQPFQHFKNSLWKHSLILQTPMAVHALLLSACLSGWRPYLDYLRIILFQYVSVPRSRCTQSPIVLETDRKGDLRFFEAQGC